MTNYKKCPYCGAVRMLYQVIDGEHIRICYKCFRVQKRVTVPAARAKAAALNLALICSLVAGPVWADGSSNLVKTHELGGDEFRALVTCNEALVCWTPCQRRMHEAMKAVAPFLSKSVDTAFREAIYISPSGLLRQEADAIDLKDAAVQQFRDVLKECAQ